MRPFPVLPRGPRRKTPVREHFLIALPRQSPQWELSALAALMKPKEATKGAIAHTSPHQQLPGGAADRLRAVCEMLARKLAIPLEPHFPPDGDFIFALTTPGDRWGESLAIARSLSREIPHAWLTVGRAFVRNGKFFNRERRFGLRLVESGHHHVPREIAAKLRRA